jgi:uncharacterized protein (DUF2062 family)
MDLDQLKQAEDQEYKLRLQESYQENQLMNLCKPVLKPLMVSYQLEEVKDS